MGYQHYFKTENCSDILWTQFIEGIERIIIASKFNIAGIRGKEGLHHDFTEGSVCLNGEGENICETLYLEKGERGSIKTRQRRYDEVVTAILLLGHELETLTDISSDGLHYEWLPGLKLFFAAFDRNPTCIPDLSPDWEHLRFIGCDQTVLKAYNDLIHEEQRLIQKYYNWVKEEHAINGESLERS